MNDKEEVIREKLWKNVGLAADIVKYVDDNDVDNEELDDIFGSYDIVSESDDVADVFNTEMFRTVKCIEHFQKHGDLKQKQGRELNQSFKMLREAAKELGVKIR